MTLFDWLTQRGLNEIQAFQGDLYYLIKETVGVDPRLFLLSGVLTQEQNDLLSSRYAALDAGQPLAYVLGSQPFLDMSLRVNEHVLIPRSDTEQWVRRCISTLDKDGCVLDIATGSGCIAVALKYYLPAWQVWACDLSEDALVVAKKNAQAHALNIHWRLWDLYALCNMSEPMSMKWDCIVSNPPYLTQEQWEMAPMLHVEPKMALVDRMGDGISCYHSILRYAVETLKSDGELWLEHGMTQREVLMAEIDAVGLRVRACYHDDAKRERVIVCTK